MAAETQQQMLAKNFRMDDLRAEFAPLFEKWKKSRQATLMEEPQKTTKSLFARALEKLPSRRPKNKSLLELSEEQNGEKEAYDNMVNYAATALALGYYSRCPTAVFDEIKKIAGFEEIPEGKQLAINFEINVRRTLVNNARPDYIEDLGHGTIERLRKEVSAQVKRTVNFGNILTKARNEAADAHENFTYQAELKKILEEARTITKKNLAFDLEGVLISRIMHFLGYWADRNRMLRPGANEILATLANPKLENNIYIWTAMKREDALHVIKKSGLILPSRVKLVSQEETAQKFEEPDHLIYTLPSEIRAKLREGKTKILEYFPEQVRLDTLLDDYAEEHQKRSQQLLNIIDNRYMNVESFKLHDHIDLKDHHRDRGLFSAIKRLKIRFGATQNGEKVV